MSDSPPARAKAHPGRDSLPCDAQNGAKQQAAFRGRIRGFPTPFATRCGECTVRATALKPMALPSTSPERDEAVRRGGRASVPNPTPRSLATTRLHLPAQVLT